jgi:EDD domain protein, DegV family
MDYKIVVDSCCDLDPELREKFGVISVPLTLMLEEKEFVDDKSLVLSDFMAKMKACVGKIGSAAPSPAAYMDAFISAGKSFAVTLSSQLSASYSSAKAGLDLLRESEDVESYIFDSKSASAAEILIVLKIRSFLDKGLHRQEIISHVENFISNMKTYFVLENHDNLVKNGRMNKLSAKVLGALDIRLVMGADVEGKIKLYSKPRGEKRMIERLVSLVGESGRKTETENLVITHCNNPGLAEKLAAEIKNRFTFKEILVLPTGGLSSLYADDQGVIMAF